MLIGIGFIAIVTAALAQRFLAERAEQIERAVQDEIETAEVGAVAELQQITARLHRLEQRLGKVGGRS
jgi:hypothetical protein